MTDKPRKETIKLRLPDGRTASIEAKQETIEFRIPKSLKPTAPVEDVKRRRKALRIVASK
jgi:hypothetical protein